MQPQSEKQKGNHGMPYGLNNAMITYQLEDRELQPLHGVLDVKPQNDSKQRLQLKLILTQGCRKLR